MRARTFRVRVHALGLAAQERHRGGITLWTKYQRLLQRFLARARTVRARVLVVVPQA